MKGRLIIGFILLGISLPIKNVLTEFILIALGTILCTWAGHSLGKRRYNTQ